VSNSAATHTDSGAGLHPLVQGLLWRGVSQRGGREGRGGGGVEVPAAEAPRRSH
jgi:hypothetical protein